MPGWLSARNNQLKVAKDVKSYMQTQLSEGIPSNMEFSYFKVTRTQDLPPTQALVDETQDEYDTWGRKFPNMTILGQ